MADFNSAYTGAEVDAAIAKTDSILGSVQVYNGSPTNTGIPMSSIGINPDTGDKTGTYDIIYAGSNTSVDTASGEPNVSRLWIGNEGQTSGGSGHSDMTDTAMWVSSADYTLNEFTATLHTHTFSSGLATDIPAYIHKIFRLQKST